MHVRQQAEKDFMHKKQKTDKEVNFEKQETDEQPNLEKHMTSDKLMHEKQRTDEELNHESKNELGEEVRAARGLTNQQIEEMLARHADRFASRLDTSVWRLREEFGLKSAKTKEQDDG